MFDIRGSYIFVFCILMHSQIRVTTLHCTSTYSLYVPLIQGKGNGLLEQNLHNFPSQNLLVKNILRPLVQNIPYWAMGIELDLYMSMCCIDIFPFIERRLRKRLISF